MRNVIVAMLASFLTVGPALGVDVNGRVWTLTEDEQKHCETEGGCGVVTADFFRKSMERAKAYGEVHCGNKT